MERQRMLMEKERHERKQILLGSSPIKFRFSNMILSSPPRRSDCLCYGDEVINIYTPLYQLSP
jgi:hypothetical protein